MVHRFKKPTLKADVDCGEGTVGIPDDWRKYDPLLRMDLLKDWIHELEEEYDRAHAENRALMTRQGATA
jgi:hypothetical protein